MLYPIWHLKMYEIIPTICASTFRYLLVFQSKEVLLNISTLQIQIPFYCHMHLTFASKKFKSVKQFKI